MGVLDRFRTVLPDSELLLRRYRALTPLYPAIVRARRLPAADVLITSSFAFANGFRTANDAPQLCYCHTPMRFAWSMRDAYADELPGGAAARRLYPLLAASMRRVDRRRAGEVTRFVANSEWVAGQIRSYYGREAAVIRPAVDTDVFRPRRTPATTATTSTAAAWSSPTSARPPWSRPSGRSACRSSWPATARSGRRSSAAAPANVRFTGEVGDDELCR